MPHSAPSPIAAPTLAARRRRLTIVIAALVAVAGVASYLWSRSVTVCCAPPPIDVAALLARNAPTAATPVPDDFALDLSGSTGSVSPPFYYRYEMHVERGGAATLAYHPGYASPDSLTLRQSFTVPDSIVRVLATLAERLQDPNGPLSEREIPDGGSSPYLMLHLNGRAIEVAPWQREPDGSWQRAIESTLRDAIPADVWSRCEEAQTRYAATLDRR